MIITVLKITKGVISVLVTGIFIGDSKNGETAANSSF